MTTDSHDNKLYKQQIVRIIVSPIYCWLLRLASKEPEYAVFLSCLYSLTAALPCKVGRDEYDRMAIEDGSTDLKKKNPTVEILLSICRTWPCQGRLAAVVPLHDKKRLQRLCISMAYEVYEEKCWGYPPDWPTIGKWLLLVSSTIPLQAL